MWIVAVFLVALLYVTSDDTHPLPLNKVPEITACPGEVVVLSVRKQSGSDTYCGSRNCFWLKDQLVLVDPLPGQFFKASNDTHHILIIWSFNHNYTGQYSFQEELTSPSLDVAKLLLKSAEECTLVNRQEKFHCNHESSFGVSTIFESLILAGVVLLVFAEWPNLCKRRVDTYHWCVQKCSNRRNNPVPAQVEDNDFDDESVNNQSSLVNLGQQQQLLEGDKSSVSPPTIIEPEGEGTTADTVSAGVN